jgi:hypothetical protein
MPAGNLPARDANNQIIYIKSTRANSQTEPALSQEDVVTALGLETNTSAPASDTAAASLNGRLVRLAQQFTTLLSLLPVSLGQKTSSASLPVVLASNQPSQPVTMTGISLLGVSGDQTIISPTAGKALRIYNLVLSNTTTLTSFALRSGTSGQGQVNLTSAIAAYDYAGDFSPPLGLPVDRSFVINLPSSGSLTGYVTWREE